MTNDLVVRNMPAMDISEAGTRRQMLVDFTKSIMVRGKDYGTIPGAGDKPTLFKPGAEKLTTFFGLAPQFIILDKEMDWTGTEHGGEPFFYLQYRCDLFRDGNIVGSGVGSCNSWEKKYRYRNVSARYATEEEKEHGRLENKSGRNGNYQVYVVKNSDPADLVNTIDKMAQKRALVAATLIAVNASEFFTQDIEDMDFGGIIEGDFEPVQETKKPTSKPAPERQPVGDVTEKQLKDMNGRLHKFGKMVYKDDWDEQRPIIVSAKTDGRTDSSTELTPDELSELIADLVDEVNNRS